jgi:hypothetical protein
MAQGDQSPQTHCCLAQGIYCPLWHDHAPERASSRQPGLVRPMLAVGASIASSTPTRHLFGTRIVILLGFTRAVRGSRCCALDPVLSPLCNLRAPSISTEKLSRGVQATEPARRPAPVRMNPGAFEGFISLPRKGTGSRDDSRHIRGRDGGVMTGDVNVGDGPLILESICSRRTAVKSASNSFSRLVRASASC